MRDRLMIGPILIALLIGGLALDQFLDKRAMPQWLADVVHLVPFVETTRDSFPPGLIIVPLMLVIAVLAARELAAMAKAKGIAASRGVMGTAAAMGVIATCAMPPQLSAADAVGVVGTSAVLSLVMSLVYYSRHKNVTGVLAATGVTLLGYVYLGLTFGFLLAIRREHSAWVLLWVLLVTKSCDIGAYFTGKAIGKHKLAVWLSPGKTWEGLAGGVVLAVVVSAVGLNMMAERGLLPWAGWFGAVLAGVVFAVVGQAGDLAKSLLKRDAGVKDSGQALPGFGGVIDIIDSPLLVTPLAFWWLRIFVGG
jgi:phosphatidate cytidylyltransferase